MFLVKVYAETWTGRATALHTITCCGLKMMSHYSFMTDMIYGKLILLARGDQSTLPMVMAAKNKIVFRYVYRSMENNTNATPLRADTTVLLCAFDERTKYNGFFQKNLEQMRIPLNFQWRLVFPIFLIISHLLNFLLF